MKTLNLILAILILSAGCKTKIDKNEKQDDIIDETQSEDVAGKTTSNDTNKNSFVNLLGLDGAMESANRLAKICYDNLDQFRTTDIVSDDLANLLIKYFNRHK